MNRNRVRLRRKLRCNRYDHIGRRVKKITPEATYTCFYDGWLLIKETRHPAASQSRSDAAGSRVSIGQTYSEANSDYQSFQVREQTSPKQDHSIDNDEDNIYVK